MGFARALIAALVPGALGIAALLPSAAVAAPRGSDGTVSPGAVAPQDPGAQGPPSLVVLRTSRPGHPIHRPAGTGADDPPGRVARIFAQRGGAGALPPGHELSPTQIESSARGGHTVKLQRFIDDVPLMGGETVVDLDADGRIRSAVAESTTDEAPQRSRSTITDTAAARTAVAEVARLTGTRRSGLRAADPQLWFFDPAILGAPGPARASLVWRTEVTAAQRDDVRTLVLVDATSGRVRQTIDEIDHALDREVCDAANGSAQYPCTTPVRVENGSATGVDDVNSAYDLAGATYDFYHDSLGRDSIDDAGMTLRSTVRYCPSSCPYENAFWNGRQMTYGTGFASADDVVAHELTHGVTEYRSGLFYFYQSGAINESLSDIFGEYVDLTDATGTDTPQVRWQLGEDLPAQVGVIRDMSDPTVFGDPDRTGSPMYDDDGPDSPSFDNGGVHSNSGIGNKFAFLLTDGGTFNGHTVVGLGIPKSAQIIYAASGLLTSAADYRVFGAALRQACSALVGSHGITLGDCDSVDSAVLATQMDSPPPASPKPDVAVCPVGGTAQTIFSDGFENSASGAWTRSQTIGGEQLWYYTGEPTIYTDYTGPKYATEGGGNLWGDDPEFRSDVRIETAAGIPVPQGRTFLRFDHAYQFERADTSNYDGGVVEYNTGSGWADAGPLITDTGYTGTVANALVGASPLHGRSAFTGTSEGYTTTRIDLSGLAGETVKIRFRIGTDYAGWGAGWFIDKFSVYRCAGLPGITPPATSPPPSTDPQPSSAPSSAAPSSTSPSPAAPTPIKAAPTSPRTPTAAPKVTPRISARAVKGRSALRVGISPSRRGSASWSFRIRKLKGGRFVTLRGSHRVVAGRTVTIDLPKGRYRATVAATRTNRAAVSAVASLRR